MALMSISLTGLVEEFFPKFLRAGGTDLATKYIREAVQDACRVVRRTSAQNPHFSQAGKVTPRSYTRTGRLSKAVRYTTTKADSQGNMQATVYIDDNSVVDSTRKGIVKYARFVYFGNYKDEYEIIPDGRGMKFPTTEGTAKVRKAPFRRWHQGAYTIAEGVTRRGLEPNPFLEKIVAQPDVRAEMRSCFAEAYSKLMEE